MNTVPTDSLLRTISCEDSVSREDVESLRAALTRDEPYDDEPPVADEVYQPDPEDSLWWSRHGDGDDREPPAHLYDREVMDPRRELSDDANGFFGFGPGVGSW